MTIDRNKLDIILAEQCKAASELRAFFSSATISRIRKGHEIGTKTAGKLAKVLNKSVTEIIDTGAKS